MATDTSLTGEFLVVDEHTWSNTKTDVGISYEQVASPVNKPNSSPTATCIVCDK